MSEKSTKDKDPQEAEPLEIDPLLGHAKLRVTDAKKDYFQEAKGDMLDVTVQLYYDEAEEDGSDRIVEEKRFTYPLKTTPDEIKADLKKVLDTYNQEQVTAAINAEHEAAQKAADETIATLTDLVLDADAEDSDTKEEEGK